MPLSAMQVDEIRSKAIKNTWKFYYFVNLKTRGNSVTLCLARNLRKSRKEEVAR